MERVKETTIGMTFESYSEYSKELGKVEVKHDRDIFECMSFNVVNEETGEKEGRIIIPNCRDFNVDSKDNPLPKNALKMAYNQADQTYVQGLYQQIAIAASGGNSQLQEVLGGATFVGFAAIYYHLTKCLYDPGTIQKDGGIDTTADFRITATNVGGVIFLRWSGESEWGAPTGVPKWKSYRLSRSILTYGSFLKRKKLTNLTVAETDNYDQRGTPVEEKESIKNSCEYWEGYNTVVHRSLQQYLEMELCGVGILKYKFSDKEQELTREDLLEKGLTEDQNGKKIGEEILKNMKCFLVKVLLDVKENLKNDHFCEIEFVRENENRKEKGSGRFTISYKGPIRGPFLMQEFTNAFNI